MKKIYILTAVLALLTLSLNAQDGKLKTASDMRLKTSSKTVKDPKTQAPSMNELLCGIKGMSSVLQATQGPNASANSGANRAPIRLNAGEELMGPFTTYDTSVSGYTSYGWSTAYGNNFQQIYIFSDLDRSAFEGHDGDEIVGYRFALGGNTSQTAVLYDFMAWPYSTNGYFEAANRHTWNIAEVAGVQPMINDIVITVGSGDVNFYSINVYDASSNTLLTSWDRNGTTTTVNLSGSNYASYNLPTGWSSSEYLLRWQDSNVGYLGYLNGQGTITLSSSLFTGISSVRVVINASTDNTSYGLSINGDSRTLTSSLANYTWTINASAPIYSELQAGQWYEYYLDEPIPFNVADSIGGMYLGYRFFQYPSTETSELLYPVAINPNSNTAGIVTNRIGQDGTTTEIGDITITIPSTYTNIRSITVSSGNTTITSWSYANNSNTFPAGWGLGGTLGLRYDYSNVAALYSSDGSGSVLISGDLTQGYSSVTVSIYFSTSTRNQTATVGVNGTNRTTTNRTGTTQTWTLNGTTVPVYTGGWWDENIAGDLAVQLIFKSSTNPTIEISPATQTINDDAAGTLTITGTDIEGNINVSAANDWSLNPTSLTSTGGDVSVTYTGTALSATTTVTASATGATDATATVNYVADLYIVGDFGTGWDFNNGTHMSYNNGIYTATLTANANSYILFARLLGNSNPWNTRDVFGPDSNGNWTMQGNSYGGNLNLNASNCIHFPEGGTYTVTIDATNGTFTITKLSENQTATPVITYTDDGEYVTITATGDGTVTLTVGGQTVSGEGSASITIPYGPAATTVTATATAQEDGKDESAPATQQVPIPGGGEGWTEMDGTYDNPADLLSFLKDGEDIMMVDQFLASTLNNDHPDHYTYTLRQTVNGETKTSTPVEIPVYKTNSSIQGLYTQTQIEEDVDMRLRANVVNSEMDYDVNPDHNVLYYSLYRGEVDADYPAIDVQSRISQLQKFEDNVDGNIQYYMFENHQTGVAPRYDRLGNEIAERLDTNWVACNFGDQISYVPVIWTFGLYSGREDGKNNSYGSDIKREKLGAVSVSIEGKHSDGSVWGKFTVGDVEYCIYHPIIHIEGSAPVNVTTNDGDVITYEPYMYRAWCTYEGMRDFRAGEDGALADNGPLAAPYLLGEEVTTNAACHIGEAWTQGDGRLQSAFAVPVGVPDNEVTFVVRFYYKKTVVEQSNGNKLRLGNGEGEEYYIAQGEGDGEGMVTGIIELMNGATPVSVTYVNMQGMKSDQPFDGVNIVVTRYSDGSTVTRKVVR